MKLLVRKQIVYVGIGYFIGGGGILTVRIVYITVKLSVIVCEICNIIIIKRALEDNEFIYIHKKTTVKGSCSVIAYIKGVR